MKAISLIILSFFALSIRGFAQDEATTPNGKRVVLFEDGTWTYADSIPTANLLTTTITYLEIPKVASNERIITHVGYALSYNELNEQANWVAYELTKEETNQIYARTDKFLVDPEIKTGSANAKDYANSGYDRGHLAPAADMGWSIQSMTESFYYSNISPQDPSFNRGIWKRLEELVRTWANASESIYVVTGPYLPSGLPTIGANQVAIPQFFYKVVLDYKAPGIKGIGFIIPNTGSTEPLQSYAVPIDKIEDRTGIDFFPLLPDEQENIIESSLILKSWAWKSISTTSPKEKQNISSVQCSGITKAGARCKNKTLNPNGYCHLHGSQENGSVTPSSTPTPTYKKESSSGSVQCSGTTKKGAQCKRMTTSSSGRCYQH